MEISNESIVGELVAENYRTASVFKENGIDFCCNGNRSIADACREKELEPGTLIQQLESVSAQKNDGTPDFNSWPLDLLTDYIEKKHHRYTDAIIGEITPFLQKIVRVHGGRHPELEEVETLFEASAGELTTHMKKEELMLFPFIRKMVAAKKSGQPVQAIFGTVQNPIGMMMHEHDTEGARFRRIAELTNNYTTPQDGCNTYQVTLSLLKELEEDLHLHIHLENNILFPKSIELEKNLV